MTVDVLVISPFRKSTFRKSISNRYPTREPWDSPPLTVCAALEQKGLTVSYLALQTIFDAWNDATDRPVLREMLGSLPARMVLFTTDYFIPSRSTATTFGMKIISEELRRLAANVLIGAAGRLPTVAGRRLLDEVPECDFLVHGEPESAMGDIAVGLLDGTGSTAHASLVTRDTIAAGGVPRAATTSSLDETPRPAWHFLELSLQWWDRISGRQGSDAIPLSLRTTAGCRFRCRFCAGVPNWLDYRKKSAERVALEIDEQREALGTRAYFSFLEDEVFTRDPEHVERVSEVFAARKIRVDGVYTHSTMLTPPVADAVSRMARRVYLGLDNIDDSILKDMRKGQQFATVMAAAEAARKAGLGTHLEWIIGSPREPVDSLITSLNAIVSLLSTGAVESINTYVYCPHPGTDYAERSEVFGLQIIEGFEEIQESGGYPAYQTNDLSQQQIFVAYLMSQIAIAEVSQARALGGPTSVVGRPNRHEMRALFERFGR